MSTQLQDVQPVVPPSKPQALSLGLRRVEPKRLSLHLLVALVVGSMIGSGICIGPAIGVAGLLLAPGQPNAGAYAVLALLVGGLAGLLGLRMRGRRKSA